MKLLKSKVIQGPNIYHNRPVVISRLDLEDMSEVSSADLPYFTDALLQLLPGLEEHTCSPGYRGGFCERLRRGTYMAHIIEHVALELSERAGIGVTYGKSKYAGSPGLYDVITRYRNEDGMLACHSVAFSLVSAVVAGEDFDVNGEIFQIREIVADSKMGPSTQAIFDAAKAKGVPCRREGRNSLLRLGYGKNIRWVQAAVTDRTSAIAVDLVQDKFATKLVLEKAGIPTPPGEVVGSEQDLFGSVSRLGYPLAIKPLDGNHGNGVCLNINCEREAKEAYELAAKFGKEILVEKMCLGRDYRALVIGGRLSAVAERVPPQVKGDGESTIAQLIEMLNADPRRGEGHSGLLSRIEVDEALLNTLKKHFLSLGDVPVKGEKVLLRENANLSGGGTAHDVTDLVHPTVKLVCERIARVVGLDICGIDLIHTDIARPAEAGMFVIEVNAGPGLRMHLAPSKGTPRDVARDIVDMLYESGEASRIPIYGVTGTNGKTSTTRLLAKILSVKGHCVGMTSSDGIWIGDDQIESGDTAGPISAAKVLSDTKVDCAVLEVARGGIMRGGLAYDFSDVGIVTNIRADHIGQDGIEDIEDLVKVKSLVVERVRDGGTVVLNADDETALSLSRRKAYIAFPRKLCLYSTRADNPALLAHLEAGGNAVWVEEGKSRARFDGKEIGIGPVSRWPVTFDGAAVFQVSNCLAAICAALAGGVGAGMIRQALEQFIPGLENPGRSNLYELGASYVLVDYGHNPDGIGAVGEMLGRFRRHRKTAVVSLPGDRDDDLIRESAHRLANHFDRVILKDDADLRGRKAGEIPRMVQDVLRSYPGLRVETVLDEGAALEKALNEAEEATVTVVFYESLTRVQGVLERFGATPTHSLAHADRVLTLVNGGSAEGEEDSVIAAASL